MKPQAMRVPPPDKPIFRDDTEDPDWWLEFLTPVLTSTRFYRVIAP